MNLQQLHDRVTELENWKKGQSSGTTAQTKSPSSGSTSLEEAIKKAKETAK
jgi:hypothetical protein